MSGDRFQDKTAVVTGGVSGIGRAVALRLAEEGASVIVTGLTDEEVNGFSAPLDSIQARQLDVTDIESIRRLTDGLESLHVLVNAAGIIQRGGKEFDLEGFAAVVDVNLHGTMRMCVACHDPLLKVRGCVINVGSLFSSFGAAHAPAYSASKGAVVQLTKSLAAAWASEGIRVNAVAPGWIRTAFTEPVSQSNSRSQAILDRTPLGRWGQPEDVAGPVLFLASNEAEFVTGSVIPVDGGYSVV
ncbi:SDR family oxidoreductase [bacterium]|nr:SDR family oxidoreductase [Verrucomicrobiota bacterium]MDA7645545.1 SDR family oxidoreductase [bacterium]